MAGSWNADAAGGNAGRADFATKTAPALQSSAVNLTYRRERCYSQLVCQRTSESRPVPYKRLPPITSIDRVSQSTQHGMQGCHALRTENHHTDVSDWWIVGIQARCLWALWSLFALCLGPRVTKSQIMCAHDVWIETPVTAVQVNSRSLSPADPAWYSCCITSTIR